MNYKHILNYCLWCLSVTAWTVVCFIFPDFCDSPIHDFSSLITIGAYLVALGIASFWIVAITGLSRYICAVFLPVFALVGAAVSYFRVAFHSVITPMVIDATLHTNGGTISGVVSWQLVLWLSVNLLVAIGFIRWRFRLANIERSWLLALFFTLMLVGYYHANERLQFAINRRFPYNIAQAFTEYSRQHREMSKERQIAPYHILSQPDSLDIIFVLGEAARADHIQLNGYERETTPLLSTRNNIVSLPHVYSEYTYTASSVPHILSPADSTHEERSGTHTSFIRILKDNAFQTAWISNQDNGYTYYSFINESDTVIFPNASKSSFVFSPWYDEQLLPPLDSLLEHPASKRLLVLHTIGSHWYYNIHVPPTQQVFQPVTENRIVTNNTLEQVINSYDNTIIYLDQLLDSLIQRFEHRPAVLIYLSDHGESLGENGDFLHAGENKALHSPACIIWYSNAYAALYPEKINALKANRNKYYRTDMLYPSILSAAGLETEEGREVDIFATENAYVNR